MRVVITGGAGFIGRKLALQLLLQGRLAGEDITELVVLDVSPPLLPFPSDPRLRLIIADFGEGDSLQAIHTQEPTIIFHLAAVVSGAAEKDFDLGMRVNLHHTLLLLDQLRHSGRSRFVFASSVAAYGGDLPDVVKDDTALNPQTSYGTQKAITELLIDDYSRRGFIDGRALRLPTIAVRPGLPNQAASSFASSIIREPLQGATYHCPVGPETEVCLLSPRQVVKSFIRAAELPSKDWGSRRTVTLPGITVPVQSMVEALRERGSDAVVDRIQWVPDPSIQKIVLGWPVRFDTQRAAAMGFEADASVGAIIDAFIEDDLNGGIVP